MHAAALRTYLDEHGVKYVVIGHSIAYTAHDTARSAHVPDGAFAKAVMVKLDGAMAMAVLRGSDKLDVHRLRRAADAATAHLASEDEFQGLFPGVEIGAMPPFGNLFDMPVYADEALAGNDRIAFNAGTHRELLVLGWLDYQRLVQPVMAHLTLDDAAGESG
jgi:Ala-tRNA(Pro) deacylase